MIFIQKSRLLLFVLIIISALPTECRTHMKAVHVDATTANLEQEMKSFRGRMRHYRKCFFDKHCSDQERNVVAQAALKDGAIVLGSVIVIGGAIAGTVIFGPKAWQKIKKLREGKKQADEQKESSLDVRESGRKPEAQPKPLEKSEEQKRMDEMKGLQLYGSPEGLALTIKNRPEYYKEPKTVNFMFNELKIKRDSPYDVQLILLNDQAALAQIQKDNNTPLSAVKANLEEVRKLLPGIHSVISVQASGVTYVYDSYDKKWQVVLEE